MHLSSTPADPQDAGLRARLVAVGVELLATEGLPALSLREIARRAGVSHGAPRRYFPTHLELLSAIARQGFSDLTDRVTKAMRDTDGARARLLAIARAYLDFAQTDQGMFDLMFRHDLLESNQLGLRETSLPLFAALTDLVRQARTRPGAPAPVAAAALWANLHGIAQLWRWGSLQLAATTDDVEPLLRAALDAHVGPQAR